MAYSGMRNVVDSCRRFDLAVVAFKRIDTLFTTRVARPFH